MDLVMSIMGLTLRISQMPTQACEITLIHFFFLFILRSVFHTDQDDPSSSDDEGMPYTRQAKFKAAHSFKGPFDFDQIKVVQDLSGEHMVGLLYHVILCTDTLCATTCLY